MIFHFATTARGYTLSTSSGSWPKSASPTTDSQLRKHRRVANQLEEVVFFCVWYSIFLLALPSLFILCVLNTLWLSKLKVETIHQNQVFFHVCPVCLRNSFYVTQRVPPLPSPFHCLPSFSGDSSVVFGLLPLGRSSLAQGALGVGSEFCRVGEMNLRWKMARKHTDFGQK